MSELSELTASPRSDLLPGYVISPFGLADYGELESEFSGDYLAKVGRAAEQLTAPIAKMMVDAALEKVSKGYFNWGSAGFDACCLSAHYLPLMLHTSLKIRHPQLSRIEAEKLITPANEYDLKRVMLEMVGFNFKKKPLPAETDQEKRAPESTGDKSSLPSANAA